MRPNNARPFIAAICTLSAGVCLHVAAKAQSASVKAVFENYNLLGTFASDCSKPASGDNFYYVHRLIDPNHAQRDRMSGATSRDYAYVIDQASGSAPNQVSVGGTRAEGNRKGEPLVEVWRVEPNRIMTVEQTIGGATVISNGQFNGRPVGWYNRCAAAQAPAPQSGAATPIPPAPSAATSRCNTDNYTFSTVLSQSTTTNSVSIGGAACFYSVAPIHPDQVEFTSASIVEQPNNGTFEQTGSFAFKYQPKPGFNGTDEYAIKVCGHNSQRAGCATVTYRVTVK
jgi:hypothetical protein